MVYTIWEASFINFPPVEPNTNFLEEIWRYIFWIIDKNFWSTCNIRIDLNIKQDGKNYYEKNYWRW